MLVFSSDNGPLPTLDRRRAGGLRGAKDSLYEGGIREPFIVRWPGHAPAGLVNDETVLTAVDLFPTLCKVAGIKTPADARLDGVDLSSAFEGKKPARKKAMFWEYGRNESFGYPKEYPGQRSPNVAVRDGKWKLVINADGSNPRAVRP